MRLSDYQTSEWLKAADLKGQDRTVTIDNYGEHKSGDGKTQVYLKFKGSEKKFGLNRTNGKTITTVLGTDELDEWIGQRITLYPTETDFQGDQVECIRVRKNGGQAAAAPKSAPRIQAEEIPDDDTIPF